MVVAFVLREAGFSAPEAFLPAGAITEYKTDSKEAIEADKVGGRVEGEERVRSGLSVLKGGQWDEIEVRRMGEARLNEGWEKSPERLPSQEQPKTVQFHRDGGENKEHHLVTASFPNWQS